MRFPVPRFLLPRYQRPLNTQHCSYMSLQKLGKERLTHYDCEIVRKACIFTIKSSAPAAQQRSQVKWLTPLKPEKTPVQRVRCFSALSSGLMPLMPPPLVIRPPNAAADHQFVGAQLYLIVRSQWPNNGNFPLRHVHICQKLHMEVST